MVTPVPSASGKVCAVLTLCLVLFFQVSNAGAQSKEPPSPEVAKPVFVPPAIGTPSERLGAGTREISGEDLGAVVLIVPEGGGYTTSETPPLIWRLPQGFRGEMRAEVSALGEDGVALAQEGAFAPGHYGLDLSRSDLHLAIGMTYEWRVMLIQGNRIVAEASSLIERLPSTSANPGTSGIWFDALAPIVSMGLSSRVRIRDEAGLTELLDAGGIDR